ncbi:DNA polymerase Y family protein [Aminicella lysinilytica]|uniref:DNA polymerase Y family protein n=1 Tax=Aminicella lysinilytica TaxID=433323 RepID=UPI0026E99494|nr:DNA polymerase IV [Aminicella lysinilytica]
MTVLQIDANSAYLSWTAAALLEQGYPVDIRTVPAVIAGNPKNRHGIILAKSIPAGKLGIGSGVSLFEARQKCPELLVFPPSFDLYLGCSDAMYEILKEYSPLIERYSVDECFLDHRLYAGHPASPVETAYEIKERIKAELGFTVNVGVGRNKLLSKMACELEKPDKVHCLLTDEDIREKMWPLDVKELFMVGRATTRRLEKINIKTIGSLAKTDPLLLKAMFKSHGTLIWEYANGIDNGKIIPKEQIVQKGIGNSMTIKYDLLDPQEARSYILSLTERVGGRLRRHRCKASLVVVSLCTGTFTRYTHQLKLPFFTSDTTTIYRYACRLLSECWKGEPIRQLGVKVGEFVRDDEYQLTVFDVEKIEKDEALNDAVDNIRSRFGSEAIYRGVFANSDLNPIEGGVNGGNFLMMGGFRQ